MIYFNADDYLLTEEDSARIEEHLLANSVVRSTSMVVTNSARTPNLNLQSEGLKIGLHLNLVEAEWLSSHKLKFSSKKEFMLSFGMRKITAVQVKAEINAQIETFRSYPIRIAHVDTHQNIHSLPFIGQIFDETLRAHNLALRSTRIYNYFGLPKAKKLQTFLTNSGINARRDEQIITHLPGHDRAIERNNALLIWKKILSSLNENDNYLVPVHLAISNFENEFYKDEEFVAMISRFNRGDTFNV